MIATRWKTPLLLGAVISPLFLAACSQTGSHGMSTGSLASSLMPSFFTTRPYGHTPKDKECLERAMFFESNRSSRDGMIAVGTVVMNRLRSGNHGNTICEVVGERGQFAPGVMTRPMNSRALPDVEEAAQAVLKGERKAKLKNTMYFHTAGLRFPYKNMHYTMVAGGNAFYEKRGRNWQPLPEEPTVAVASVASPTASVMVASAAPAPAVTTTRTVSSKRTFVTATSTAKSARVTPSQTMVAMQEPMAEPDAARFGGTANNRVIASVEAPPQETAMGFQSTPENTDAVGALIASQTRPLQED